MKVAIFGGSFDPPHIGHEEIIKKALQKLDIDVLFVIPTYLNPFKNDFFAPPNLRYKWVKKLLLPYKKTKIIDYELKQSKPTPTIQTVDYIKNLYHPEKIYLIIGADNLKKLHQWHEYERLKNSVEFIIATRDELEIPKNLQILKVNANISSTILRKKIDKNLLPTTLADEIINYYTTKGEK